MKTTKHGFFLWVSIFSILFMLIGCKPTPENTEVVVSDAISSNGSVAGPEIVPNATVYLLQNKDKKSLLKYLLADKVSDIEVQFFAREIGSGEDDWIRLGDTPLYTDENGRVSMEDVGVRPWLPPAILDAAPIDLELRAKVLFEDGGFITDDMGLLRVLSSDSSDNPQVVLTDHDNTLHATGGQNSLADWVEFINWARCDWPLVDEYVVDATKELHIEGHDIVIVSGLPADIRALARSQVNRHFEDEGQRSIAFFIKNDLPFEHGNEFKAAAIGILKELYGDNNILTMVGDTVREDGYGAFFNKIFYIPFQVDYFFNTSLLDSEGFGFIDPKSIAWNWSQVMDFIQRGDIVTNFFERNENGFLNIAHRGGKDLRPENTILAYRHALEVGSESLEGDLHATSDGVVVVSHDKTVDRTTNGTGEIREMTFAELRELDAGYWFTDDGGITYPYRSYPFGSADHIQMPTLQEVFSDPVLDRAPMVSEVKQSEPSIIDDVLDIIQTYDMQDKLILGSFNKESLDELRAKALARGMNIVTSFAEEEVLTFFLTPLSAMLITGYTPPGQVLQVPIEYDLAGLTVEVINSSFMHKARYLGLKVQVWTVNDPDEMRWLIDEKKVDGIMSDNPLLLEEIITE